MVCMYIYKFFVFKKYIMNFFTTCEILIVCVAERSKAPVSGTGLVRGAGSNPAAHKFYLKIFNIILFFLTGVLIFNIIQLYKLFIYCSFKSS
jgi:hypothetical protein